VATLYEWLASSSAGWGAGGGRAPPGRRPQHPHLGRFGWATGPSEPPQHNQYGRPLVQPRGIPLLALL